MLFKDCHKSIREVSETVMISVGIDLGQTHPSIRFISGWAKSMFLTDGSVDSGVGFQLGQTLPVTHSCRKVGGKAHE